MQKAIIGKKIGMMQVLGEKGNVVPVTATEAGPYVVSQKETVESDGYVAIQVGFDDGKLNRSNKPLKGHFAKANVAPKRILREFKLFNTDAYNVDDLIKVGVFEKGDKVDVSGINKGKGYIGAIECWNFQRPREVHGTGPVARHRGSLGTNSSPSRVFGGLKVAGHMSAEKVTVRNLTVVKVDTENNLAVTKEVIPGPNGGVAIIRDSAKA